MLLILVHLFSDFHPSFFLLSSGPASPFPYPPGLDGSTCFHSTTLSVESVALMRNPRAFPQLHCRHLFNWKLCLLLSFSMLHQQFWFRFLSAPPAYVWLKIPSAYCATYGLIQICSQRKFSWTNAETQPKLSETESETVYDTIFLLLICDGVVFFVVNTSRSEHYNKRFLILNIVLTMLRCSPLALLYYMEHYNTVVHNV